MTTTGSFTLYPLPNGGTEQTEPGPQQITAGADGNIWFTDAGENKVWRITTIGELTNFPIGVGAEPGGITRGSDGANWFTARTARGCCSYGADLERMTTAGVTTNAFPIPAGSDGISVGPVASGPDGDIWLTDYDLLSSAGQIVRITKAGATKTYRFPTYVELDGITAGPDGSVWFTAVNNQTGSSAIGRLSLA